MNTAPKYSYEWFINQYREAKEDAKTFVEQLEPGIFNRKPSPETWSIAECYDHIILYNELYLDQIDKGFKKAEISYEKEVYKPGFLWKRIFKWLKPPYKRKIGTLAPFDPADSDELNQHEVLDRVLRIQDQYLLRLQEARERSIDLGSKTARNPVLSFIRMSLSECFGVVDAHQRRHLWQATRILKMLEEEPETTAA